MGDARVTKRFQVYLKRLGSGRDWNEVLTIEKARREMSVATAAAVSLEREAGRLVERGDLDRAVAKIRDAWWREAQQIAGLLILRLADLPAEQRARIKVAAEAEVGAAAERVKAAMQ
jgi:hypothetical protein